jgi:hypothetical protein
MKNLHAFLTLACVLHDLHTSLSYIIYQTVMSTPMCKKLPRWRMKTNTSSTKYSYLNFIDYILLCI